MDSGLSFIHQLNAHALNKEKELGCFNKRDSKSKTIFQNLHVVNIYVLHTHITIARE